MVQYTVLAVAHTIQYQKVGHIQGVAEGMRNTSGECSLC